MPRKPAPEDAVRDSDKAIFNRVQPSARLDLGGSVRIEYQDREVDKLGRRTFFAVWTSPEMVRAHNECEGSCCVDWRTEKQMPPEKRGHRKVRAQIFKTQPIEAITRWRAAGYTVTEHEL